MASRAQGRAGAGAPRGRNTPQPQRSPQPRQAQPQARTRAGGQSSPTQTDFFSVMGGVASGLTQGLAWFNQGAQAVSSITAMFGGQGSARADTTQLLQLLLSNPQIQQALGPAAGAGAAAPRTVELVVPSEGGHTTVSLPLRTAMSAVSELATRIAGEVEHLEASGGLDESDAWATEAGF